MTATRENDVVELLVDQHNEIRRLFGQLETAKGDRRRDLFEDLVRLLAVHETADEEIIHPVARKKIGAGEQVVDKRLAEEEDVKQMLAELHDLGIDHPEFAGKLAKLRDDTLQHNAREETEEFTDLRQVLDTDQRRGMAEAVKAAEKSAPTRPHPGVGVSPAANLLAGPPMAVFDRIRDSVRDWRRSHEVS